MTTARQFALAGAALFAAVLAACVDNTPDVVMETGLGDIVIEVDPSKAPQSAGDFLRYVDYGLYDGQSFYRTVTPDTDPRGMGMSLVQGGRSDLRPKPEGGFVPHEGTAMTGLSNTPGTIALARDAVGTGSAAFFFVNLGDNSFLDEGGTRNPDGAGYAVFGRVVEGLDTLKAIQTGEVGGQDELFAPDQKLVRPVRIEKAYRK